jgi:hypothetical protein
MQIDLNRIGLALGVGALVLAIPLAVLANLVTPKAQTYLARTSIQRLRKRLAALETMKAQADASWQLSSQQDLLFMHLRLLQQILFMLIALICIVVFVALRTFHAQIAAAFHNDWLPTILTVAVVVLYGGVGGMSYLFGRDARRDSMIHTNSGQMTLLEQIQDLKARLPAQNVVQGGK